MFGTIGFAAIVATTIWAAPSTAHVAESVAAPCVVDAYLRALERTMQRDATAVDVGRLAALLADDVVYRHPRIGMEVEGRARFESGQTDFLGRIADGGISVRSFDVEND